METDKYYMRVGAFFLAVTVLAVFFLGMFIFEAPENKFQRYAIYFEGAVSGLSEGSRVTLKGIDVGHVHSIGFYSYQDDMIEVLVDIEESAPIREDTVASVRFQGITGGSYIFLENKFPEQPPVYLTRHEGQRYAIIQSDQSDLYAALSSAPEVLSKISSVSMQVEKMLNDENLETLSSIMDSIDEIIGTDNQRSFSNLINNIERFFDENNQEAVESLIRNTDAAMIEAKTALREYKLLAKTLREDPSKIIRGSKHQGYELRE